MGWGGRCSFSLSSVIRTRNTYIKLVVAVPDVLFHNLHFVRPLFLLSHHLILLETFT